VGVIYLRKESYLKLIRLGKDPGEFVNKVVEEAIKDLEQKDK